MGATSKIQWTTHTFNPWRGCTKISEGCKFCYAEAMSKRNPGVLGTWGDQGTRVIASEAKWREPIRWDEAAELALERPRVFCASLADVWEHRAELNEPRSRLFGLIDATPNLDWLLLTKRPENHWSYTVRSYDPENKMYWGQTKRTRIGIVRPNVWNGTTCEDQENAERRIDNLIRIPSLIRFLSIEPMLGPVDLRGGSASASANDRRRSESTGSLPAAKADRTPDRAISTGCGRCATSAKRPASRSSPSNSAAGPSTAAVLSS